MILFFFMPPPIQFLLNNCFWQSLYIAVNIISIITVPSCLKYWYVDPLFQVRVGGCNWIWNKEKKNRNRKEKRDRQLYNLYNYLFIYLLIYLFIYLFIMIKPFITRINMQLLKKSYHTHPLLECFWICACACILFIRI